MKAVVQRVKEAKVTVDGILRGAIGSGLLIFLGIHKDDTPDMVLQLVSKLTTLRIFEDDTGKMNRGIKDVAGSVLVVSQFTLYANTRKGRRPDFLEAALPDKAQAIYQSFLKEMQKEVGTVESGVFGAHMEVSLVNDGPVTLILEQI